MNTVITKILKAKIFAVIGVSRDPKKYGTKVYYDLKKAKKKVYAINPQLKKIDNEKVYSTLNDLPEKPEVIVFVVKPQITEKILENLNNNYQVWIQPGAESKKTIKICKEKNIPCIYNQCIMVQRALYPH